MSKKNKTVTMQAEVAVTKMENGLNYLQVLPDDPRVGMTEPFCCRGKGQMLSNGTFDFVQTKRHRSKPEFKGPHLWCKMQFFGDAIRQANNGDERIGRRGPRNLLELLPDTFTIEEAVRARRQQGLPDKGVSQMIRVWKSRNYVLQITDNSFQKLRFKSDK